MCKSSGFCAAGKSKEGYHQFVDTAWKNWYNARNAAGMAMLPFKLHIRCTIRCSAFMQLAQAVLSHGLKQDLVEHLLLTPICKQQSIALGDVRSA